MFASEGLCGCKSFAAIPTIQYLQHKQYKDKSFNKRRACLHRRSLYFTTFKAGNRLIGREANVPLSVKRTITLLLLICVVSGAFFVGRTLGASRQQSLAAAPARMQISRADLPGLPGLPMTPIEVARGQEPAPNVAPADVFEESLSNVQRNFVEINDIPLSKIDGDALVRMVASLGDPKTRALNPERRRARQSALLGKYYGLGAVFTLTRTRRVDVDYNHLTVVDVMPASPAARCGLRSGDYITEIDGRWIINYTIYADRDRIARETDKDDATRDAEAEKVSRKFRSGLSLSRALDRLELGEGKTYLLTVERAGVPQPLKIEATTALTPVAPVEYKTLASRIGYLRVRQFNSGATDAFEAALDKAQELKGLIVDLRQNPGGVTSESRSGVDGYTSAKKLIARLTEGGVVAGIEHKPRQREALTITASPAFVKLRMVVLVDGGTANLAELVAASLRDAGKAKLVGAHTFGDDVLQLFAPLKSGLGVEITVAHLFTLGGADLARGLEPDILVAAPADAPDTAVQRALALLGA